MSIINKLKTLEGVLSVREARLILYDYLKDQPIEQLLETIIKLRQLRRLEEREQAAKKQESLKALMKKLSENEEVDESLR